MPAAQEATLMRNRLRASRLSPAAAPGLAAAAVAITAVLAGCGSVQAPGTAAGQGGSAGLGSTTGPAATASPTGTTSQAAGISASASAPASPSSSAPGTVTATCTSAGLKVALDTAAAGVAAGSYYVPLEFTNTSGHACELQGYPAVVFTSGSAGQQIGPAATADRAVPASAVQLAPQATAHAWLQLVSAADYPASKCHPVTAAGLQVAAPGSQSASYVAHPVQACRTAMKGSEILTVHPVQQGRARRGTA
jgi:hypothetical protein